MTHTKGWIGVDLDATLAHYDGWKGADHIGAPVERMVERVKQWRSEGIEVRIFTARVFPLGLIQPNDDLSLFCGANDREAEANYAAIYILQWCETHLGERLPITCVKDYAMVDLWDDRAHRVVANTGLTCCEQQDK